MPSLYQYIDAAQPSLAMISPSCPLVNTKYAKVIKNLTKHLSEQANECLSTIRYFTGMSICDKLVIHPSYQRRGHATLILQWGLRLCDMDTVDQGFMPSHVGEPLYVGLGYEVIGEIRVPNDGEVDGFSQRVAVHKAKRERTV